MSVSENNTPLKNVYYCISNHRRRRATEIRSLSCIIVDHNNHSSNHHHDATTRRQHRYNCGSKTILVFVPLVILILIQYNNSIYTLSLVRSMVSFDSVVVNVQRSTSTEITTTTADTNVTTVAENVEITHEPSNGTTPRRRILIAQYTASTQSFFSSSSSFPTNNIYDQFLQLTSKVNAAYAVEWNHDFWIMHGIAFRDANITIIPQQQQQSDDDYTIEKRVIHGHRQPLCTDDDCWVNTTTTTMSDDVPPSRSTYNKIAILELALLEKQYDGLLLLDADAMMYDFSRDIADLLSPKFVLMAHKTNFSEGTHTGSINVGVTLWNLRHTLTPYVAQRWKSNCLRRILYHKDDKLDDDQAPLQFLLKQELDQYRRDKVVVAVEEEFYYARGTFVRHFIRPAGTTWTNHTIDSESTRLLKIERSVHDVCTKYHLMCDDDDDDDDDDDTGT